MLTLEQVLADVINSSSPQELHLAVLRSQASQVLVASTSLHCRHSAHSKHVGCREQVSGNIVRAGWRAGRAQVQS